MMWDERLYPFRMLRKGDGHWLVPLWYERQNEAF